MKKKAKKILAEILAIVLIVSMMPVNQATAAKKISLSSK